jgi:hypothetical protein
MDSFYVAFFVAEKNATKKPTTKLPFMAGVSYPCFSPQLEIVLYMEAV